jgi:hypothetical protein
MPRARISASGRGLGAEFQVRAGAGSTFDVTLGEQRLLGASVTHTRARRAQVRRSPGWCPPGIEIAEGRPRACGRLRLRRGSPTRGWTITRSRVDSPATAEELARADTANRGANPLQASVPLLSQRLRSATLSSIEARVRLLQPRRHLLVGVHHALADDGAHAHLVERSKTTPCRTVSIVRRWSCRRGEPGGGEPGRRAWSVPGVCAASMGHTRCAATEERHVVGVTAEERLAQVDVGLDEAGEQYAPPASIASWDSRVPRRPPRSVRHGPRLALHDVARIVHGEDGGVADQC